MIKRLLAAAGAAVMVCAGPPALGQSSNTVVPAPAPAPPAPPAEPAADEPAPSKYDGLTIRQIELVKAIDGKPNETQPIDRSLAALVRNQMRSTAGRPFLGQTLRDDVGLLTRLGRFSQIYPTVTPTPDGRVDIRVLFHEQPMIEAVQSVGNRLLSDAEINAAVGMLTGTRIDPYQIDRAARQIETLYRSKNYYNARVSVDEQELADSGVLVFRIREGEPVKVTDIRFEGNDSLPAKELRSTIKTNIADPIFRSGLLDDTQLDQDVASLIDFYRDRGYLDVRADRRVQPAPNGREAIVTFLVDEGPLYTLRSVRLDHRSQDGEAKTGRFDAEQIIGLMKVKPGDVYSVAKIEESVKIIERAYGNLGYADIAIRRQEIRDVNAPVVDLLLTIAEGRAFLTGEVFTIGNTITRSDVILRQIDLQPDRPLDVGKLEDAKTRLESTGLVERDSVRIVVQDPSPDDIRYRDVLISVKETNTGEFNIGAAVDSDSGVVGRFGLVQRNFDIADTPDSFEELISGRAFRGGGQRFSIDLSPGDQQSEYAIGLTEPAFLDTDYSLGAKLGYRTRDYREYDEERYGGRITFGRRFGTRWTGNVFVRNEWVALGGLEADSPVDYYDVEERSLVNGLGLELIRTTVDSRFRPTRGTRTELSVEQVGLLYGDYEFTKLKGDFTIFLPIDRTFTGVATVLSLKTRMAYIPQDADDVPTYERNYLGGNSFRGFGTRAVSPIGIRNDTKTPGDEPVGGTWSFFAGAELNQPIYEDMVAAVGFIDTGTVLDHFGFEDYRVSVGVGARILVKQLSPVPLAFDLGFPILREDTDRKRLLTFSLDLPF